MSHSCTFSGHVRRFSGYLSDVTANMPYLIALGFAPVGAMLLLVVVTRLENSLPHDNTLCRRRLKG